MSWQMSIQNTKTNNEDQLPIRDSLREVVFKKLYSPARELPANSMAGFARLAKMLTQHLLLLFFNVVPSSEETSFLTPFYGLYLFSFNLNMQLLTTLQNVSEVK